MEEYKDNEYMTMTISTIPEWLRESEIYRNFQEGEGEFQLESKFIVPTSTIKNIEDFRRVIQAYTFWCLDKIPDSVYKFILMTKDMPGYTAVKEIFSNYIDLWNKLDIIIDHRKKLGFRSIETFMPLSEYHLPVFARMARPMLDDFVTQGYIDCVEFFVYLFKEKDRQVIFGHTNIYITVMKSKLDYQTKFELLNKLKNMGFRLPHTHESISTDIYNLDFLIWLHKNGANINNDTLNSVLIFSPSNAKDMISYILDTGVVFNMNDSLFAGGILRSRYLNIMKD